MSLSRITPVACATTSCAGGVTTSLTGIVYPANTAFLFYEDGSSVTATATPNPDFPAMVFAGWTGSLTGNTNPQITTVQDQFVPTATFNLTSTPITITSFTPATLVAKAAGGNLTVTGTRFGPSAANMFANWNGNSRTFTFVNSTTLTLHLNPGDFANPGGQDVFVGNFTTNAPNGTCSVGAESSFPVKPAP
jgi:hypothetical protein